MPRRERERPDRPAWTPVAAAVLLSLVAGALFALQVRRGFVPFEHALDLTRPGELVVAGSVGPSELGLLRWEGDTPLGLRMPGLGPPARLRLKLLPECPGTVLVLRAGERSFAELALAPGWTAYELAPDESGEVLLLERIRPPPTAAARCPVHLSAARTTTVVRRSSGFPELWVIRRAPGAPPPERGPGAPVAAALLLTTAAGCAAGGRRWLARWLRLVAPGVAVLAAAAAATQAADLLLVYPPASFPVLLLLPGAVWLAWRHRRTLLGKARGPATAAAWAVEARPALTLALLALGGWTWILAAVAEAGFGGDLRGLVHFGSRFDSAEPFPGAPTSSHFGYDGQFYAVLATDPFLTRPETLERLDDPSYRAVRVLVPLLSWALALGRPEAAVWTYMGLCWVLALATVPLVARWLAGSGASGWWVAL